MARRRGKRQRRGIDTTTDQEENMVKITLAQIRDGEKTMRIVISIDGREEKRMRGEDHVLDRKSESESEIGMTESIEKSRESEDDAEIAHLNVGTSGVI
jgi:hypothetical protein